MSRDNFLVVFKDGTRAVIQNISNYVIDEKNKIVRVEKDNRNNFFNFDEIKYCGTEWELDNKGD